MRKYFSYRELQTPWGKIPLDYHLRNNFGNLKFKFELAIANGGPSGDGRLLGYIEAEDEAVVDMILRSFICDAETTKQVVKKIKRWHNLNAKIIADKVIIPTIP